MNIQVIAAILGVIEQAVALLGTGNNTVKLVDSIIIALEKFLPLIGNFIPTFYQSVKNIIAALTADPATLSAQLTALQALDAQVDEAFEAAAVDVDPDRMPPAV